MKAASWPRPEPEAERLLQIDAVTGSLRDATVGELPELLSPGDVVVLNDAATLPAALSGRTTRGERLEARLFGLDGARARALVFGAGSWRTPTEKRLPPPPLAPGDVIDFGGLSAEVEVVESAREIGLRFLAQGAALYRGLYAHGRPVQYSYLAGDYRLWHVQSRFAARPWAVEMPSAGRPLTFGVLTRLVRRGIGVVALTHAAGLSSTGSLELDAALPLPERYEIPERSAARVRSARRVIAVGTSVVRALEAAWLEHGELRAGAGVARLRLSGRHARAVVDGVLTGAHAPGSSHFELLESFAPTATLERAHAHSERMGYLGHELGDSWLVLAPRAQGARAA